MKTSPTVLIILDVQKGFFTPKSQLYQADQLIKNINNLIKQARNAQLPIIFVQHCGGDGHPLNPKSTGHGLIEDLSIMSDDVVLLKKHPDAFQSTELNNTLNQLGVKNIILTGLQTEYCIDATCRRAYSLDYNVILVGDAHSTFDSEVLNAQQIIAHHNHLLGNLFAKVMLTKDVETPSLINEGVSI